MRELLKKLIEKEKSFPCGTFGTIFANNLKYLRKSLHLTQKQIAEQLGISESTYANWEQGRREPSIFDVYNLIYVLNVPATDLFSWEY